MLAQLEKIKKSKAALKGLSTDTKNQVLVSLSEKLLAKKADILACNQQDVLEYKNNPAFHAAYLDRLTLTEKRLHSMSESLKKVAKLKDPLGDILEEKTLPNGLYLKKKRVPLGVLFLIFESRPNVITEAFSLGFKAGNALILKGGKESHHSAGMLYQLIRDTLSEFNISPDVFWGLAQSPRAETDFLLKQNKYIDVLIPRGGDKLIEYVTEHSRIPIIKNDRGLCHLYVHEKAEIKMAREILINAKTQRPGVCNSVETLLVDEAIAREFLPLLYTDLRKKEVSFFACPTAYALFPIKDCVQLATPPSFDTEYLDLKLNVKVVPHLEAALAHIEAHGSSHSEAIVTSDAGIARQFEERVDAGAVYWNASTRFTDGEQFGLGAEIGISTQKLHVRGPVGLFELTSFQWIIEGQGQVRPD